MVRSPFRFRFLLILSYWVLFTRYFSEKISIFNIQVKKAKEISLLLFTLRVE